MKYTFFFSTFPFLNLKVRHSYLFFSFHIYALKPVCSAVSHVSENKCSIQLLLQTPNVPVLCLTIFSVFQLIQKCSLFSYSGDITSDDLLDWDFKCRQKISTSFYLKMCFPFLSIFILAFFSYSPGLNCPTEDKKRKLQRFGLKDFPLSSSQPH